MTAYRFVQGIDYGPRDGTRGLEFHMAEGGNGTVGFLARRPGEDLHQWADRVNGVSANAVILTTGELVQMVDWGHASGNVNPGDRAGEYGYYGHHHLVDVLGDRWVDPNTWSISVELCGYRSSATAPSTWTLPPGPTPAQVETAIRWGNEMVGLFPTIRGTWGHHDQAPKGCPGTTANMKAIFDGLGGHGLWPKEVDVAGVPVAIDARFDGTCRVSGANHAYIDVYDGDLHAVPDGWPGEAGKEVVYLGHLYADWTTKGGTTFPAGTELVGVGLNEAVFLRRDVVLTPRPPVDCAPLIETAVTAQRNRDAAIAAKAAADIKGGVA